jgi:hypothetical protein
MRPVPSLVLSAFLVVAVLLAPGCDKTKRLSAQELDHYNALKVFMDEDQEKAFLKNKTEEARNAYLKERGLWERFYQYDESKRESILSGDVKVGWEEQAVYMAWGAPYKRLSASGRQAELSEKLQYRFEVSPEGATMVWTPRSRTVHKAVRLYEIILTVDDGRVARMVRADCVPNYNFCDEIVWEKGS